MVAFAGLSSKIDLTFPLLADNERQQLDTKTLVFTGKYTLGGLPVLYMKPALYHPVTSDLDALIRSLVYKMHAITEIGSVMTKGFAFMANMNDWKMANFSVNYAKTFFDTIQGKFPAKCKLFFIVNPPPWFGKIWRIIRTFMTKSFEKMVKIVPESALREHFLNAGDYADTLGGKLDLDQAHLSFLEWRYQQEGVDFQSRAVVDQTSG